MRSTRFLRWLRLATFLSGLRLPARALQNADELFSNCSSLALEAVTPFERPDAAGVYALWNSKNDDDLITSIVARSNRSFVLVRDQHRVADAYHLVSPAAYLLSANDAADFSSLHSALRTIHSTRFPRTAFVVCLRNANFSTLKAVAESLYAINAYNFVILKPGERRTAAVDVYKWYPFAERSCCGAALDVRRVNVCDGRRMWRPTGQLFAMNLSPNFPEGCVVNAAAFHWPPYTYASPPETNNFDDGLNVRMMEALSRVHGVRVNYTLVDNRGRWGVLLKNGTWTGILGVLQRAEVDVALGQILQTPPRFRYFDCSYTSPLFMKFYLARPDKLPHWKSMIRIFSFPFWMTVLSVYVVTSVFICLVSRSARHSETAEFRDSVGNCFLNLWRVALSTPAVEPTSRTARLVFLSWLVYSFHITLIYSSALLGVITTPMMEEPSIRTMEEFSNSDLHLLVVPQFLQITSLMDEGIREMIAAKYGELKITNTEEVEQMIQKKDFAIVDPDDHFEIVAREKLEYIYTLDDFVRLNQGVYLTKGNIFLKYVDDIQRLVMENGLFEKWRRDLVGADKYLYRKRRKVGYRNEVLPLTTDELSGAFYLLLFGLSVCLICFCLELGYKYTSNLRK